MPALHNWGAGIRRAVGPLSEGEGVAGDARREAERQVVALVSLQRDQRVEALTAHRHHPVVYIGARIGRGDLVAVEQHLHGQRAFPGELSTR